MALLGQIPSLALPPMRWCGEVQVYVTTQPLHKRKGNLFPFNDNKKENQINSHTH